MSPQEMRPDSPVETPEEPRDPCQHWRGILRFQPQLQVRTSALAATREESREASSQLAWRLDFPEATGAGPSVHRRNPTGTTSFLPQLEKNQEILPSTPDEAIFCYGISREFPPSLLNLEKVLDTVEPTQEVPRNTRLHSSGTPSVPPQCKKRPGFPSSS